MPLLESHIRYSDRSVPLETRLGALKLYRAHLVSQYSDRCSFWSLRDLSADHLSRTVTLITDGADQVPAFNAFDKLWN